MGWWEQGWGVASLCREYHQRFRRCGFCEIRPDRVVTTTPVTYGMLGSGSGGGVVGSGGGAYCDRIAGSGGAVGSGVVRIAAGLRVVWVLWEVGVVRIAAGLRVVWMLLEEGVVHMEYVLDVMGAWLDIDISGMEGGVCKGGVYAFRMWWCAIRMILFIWTS